MGVKRVIYLKSCGIVYLLIVFFGNLLQQQMQKSFFKKKKKILGMTLKNHLHILFYFFPTRVWPWYNRKDWLGIQKQLFTYLQVCSIVNQF